MKIYLLVVSIFFCCHLLAQKNKHFSPQTSFDISVGNGIVYFNKDFGVSCAVGVNHFFKENWFARLDFELARGTYNASPVEARLIETIKIKSYTRSYSFGTSLGYRINLGSKNKHYITTSLGLLTRSYAYAGINYAEVPVDVPIEQQYARRSSYSVNRPEKLHGFLTNAYTYKLSDKFNVGCSIRLDRYVRNRNGSPSKTISFYNEEGRITGRTRDYATLYDAKDMFTCAVKVGYFL